MGSFIQYTLHMDREGQGWLWNRLGPPGSHDQTREDGQAHRKCPSTQRVPSLKNSWWWPARGQVHLRAPEGAAAPHSSLLSLVFFCSPCGLPHGSCGGTHLQCTVMSLIPPLLHVIVWKQTNLSTEGYFQVFFFTKQVVRLFSCFVAMVSGVEVIFLVRDHNL